MGKIVNLIQGSAEWLAWRQLKIGSSDAAVIMGVNPWKTRLQLWKEKVLGETVQENDAMRRGKELESLARLIVNRDFHSDYQPCCMEHDIYPCIIGSFDGYDSRWPMPILEIKCPSTPENFMKTVNGGSIPEYYYPQVQHLMMVANANGCLFNVFFNEECMSYPVCRDDEYCEKLLKAELEFYGDMINYRPPIPAGFSKIADESLEKLSKLYEEIGQLMDNFEVIRAEIKEKLVFACDGKDAVIGNLKIQKIEAKGRIDYEKIELLKNLDLEQYRKPSSVSWRLLPVKG